MRIQHCIKDAFKSGAKLFCAKLEGARFEGANLRGADLSRAKIRDADLSRAIGVAFANLRDIKVFENND
ncbi:MAG: pentapeptide repeat-containing protein [Rikenellaceae bacterium]